ADHAGRRAADLDMGNGTNGLQLEHEVECGDFQRPDMRHSQHVGHIFDGRFREPALLLLRTPEKRDERRGLAALGILGDLPLRPGEVGGGEFEPVRLYRRETTQHQRSTSPKTISMVPMIAATSASKWPLAIQSIDCRCR